MEITSTQNNKVAIIVAPNGARKTKADHPALPITTEEIIAEVIQCRDAGATMVHLHVRDENGQHTLDIELNRTLYKAVKERVGDSLLVQLTTEAVGMYSADHQIALTKAVMPEAGSFALRELIPTDSSSDLERGKIFFHWLSDNNILSQVILYDQDDINRFTALVDSGVIPRIGIHTLIVLGRHHPNQLSSPWDLYQLDLTKLMSISAKPCICAFGHNELDCLYSALLLGMDIRVGFENNHLLKNGKLAKNNAEQVRNIKKINNLSNISFHNAYSFRCEMFQTELISDNR